MNGKKWMLIGGIMVVTLVVAAVMVPLAFATGPVINGGIQQYMLEDNTGAGFQMGPADQWGRMRNGAGRFGSGMDTLQAAGPRGRGQGQGFVDENGDGVCDNCTGGGHGPGFTDEDGDGVCDHLAADGRGRGFVDQDGDGVCDNCGTGGGRGFTDEDGDGVCDHLAAGERGGAFVDEDGDGVCDHAGLNNQQRHGLGGGNQGRGPGQGWMGRWAGAQQSQLTQ